MRNGLPAGPLPTNLNLPFRDEIERACEDARGYGLAGFSPFVAYAIKSNETVASTDPAILQNGADPATGLLPDGSTAGRGIFQLTSSFPSDWRDPYANARYALEHSEFLMECEAHWAAQGYQGEDLVKLIAASFNAGIGGATRGHEEGDCDRYTTDGYGARAVAAFQALREGRTPW